MNNEIHVSIQALEKKIMQLLERYKDQQEMIQKLQKENEQLRQQMALEDKQSCRFLNSAEIGMLMEGQHSKQAAELGNKINSYIQDIDNCIVYLEQLQ